MNFNFSRHTRTPLATAVLKHSPADFQVEEVLGFTPDGQGEHVYLLVEKQGLNTQDIVKRLCRLSGCRERDIGFSGLKDRHAVTRQWFSVHMPGNNDSCWQALEDNQVRCLEASRHGRKLRRGTHRCNRFTILLRSVAGKRDDLEKCLLCVSEQGVPNYFGEQRFGHRFANIDRAEKMLRGEIEVKSRTKRGLYLSALRSMLFNLVLSQRVGEASWSMALDGELLVLDGSNSFFQAQAGDPDIERRMAERDIHPSGPLWGKLTPGKFDLDHEVFKQEQEIMASHGLWCKGLEDAGMKYERRALRLPVQDLEWRYVGQELELKFSLPKGAFATSVLREIVEHSGVGPEFQR